MWSILLHNSSYKLSFSFTNITIYRPPNKWIPIFIDDFQNIIDNSSTKTIFNGDFSIPLNINPFNTRKFISLIESSNCSQYINESTHISGKILDYVISHNINTLTSNHCSKLQRSHHHILTFNIYVNKHSRHLETINHRKINNIYINFFY